MLMRISADEPGGKPLREVSQTCQRIRGRGGGRETVGGDLAILAELPWIVGTQVASRRNVCPYSHEQEDQD